MEPFEEGSIEPSWGRSPISGLHPPEPDVPKLSWLHCTVQLGSRCDCTDTNMTYGVGHCALGMVVLVADEFWGFGGIPDLVTELCPPLRCLQQVIEEKA